MIKFYFYDIRFYYDLLVFFMFEFKEMKNLCDLYIGIYGIYVEEMRKFVKVVNDGVKEVEIVFKFLRFCLFKNFDY